MDPPPTRGRDGGARRTFGELRKQLAEMGDPWEPDPSRVDDEPIPEYPTGGELGGETPGNLVPEGGVDGFLRGHAGVESARAQALA